MVLKRHLGNRFKCFVNFIGGVQEVSWFWDPCSAKRPHKVLGQSIQGGCVPTHLPQRQGDSACLPFSGQISQQVNLDFKGGGGQRLCGIYCKVFFCLWTPKRPYYKYFLSENFDSPSMLWVEVVFVHHLKNTIVNIRCLPCLFLPFLVFKCVSLMSVVLMDYFCFYRHSFRNVCGCCFNGCVKWDSQLYPRMYKTACKQIKFLWK